MKTCGGVDVQIHVFLTSALVGGKWPASRPGRFTPAEKAPVTYWIGGWVSSRTVLHDVERRKSFTYRDSNPDFSAVQPVTIRETEN
jgi:hypothetical protein